MKIFTKRRQKIGAIVGISVIIVGVLFVITTMGNLKIINKSVTIEAGDLLDLKVEELVKADDDILSQVSIDASSVNTNKTGEYKAFLSYKDKKYEIKVVVVDTKAPKVVFKTRCCFTNDIKNLNIEEMYESVEEYSKYEVGFTSYEKETELAEITEEQIKTLEDSLHELDSQKEMKEENEVVVPEEEGVYRCVIKFEDSHGNASYEEVFVILDKTVPVIDGDTDVTIKTDDLSKEPEVNMKEYQITDNVDGVLPEEAVTHQLELTDSENHVYVNHISAADRAGNICNVDIKITLVKKITVSTSAPSSGTSSVGSTPVNVDSALAHEISGFPVVYQRPELPTGCEVTALTMALNYYGYPVSKTTMASDYLPQVASGYTGRVDLDYYFCGNPYGVGIGCGAGALVTAANDYLSANGSSLRGVDISGASIESLYSYVSEGKPVVVMVTIGMANRKATKGWYTSGGKYVTWSENDHGVVLIGWDSDTVKIACPLYGIKTYSRAQFERAYLERGNRAMILQ